MIPHKTQSNYFKNEQSTTLKKMYIVFSQFSKLKKFSDSSLKIYNLLSLSPILWKGLFKSNTTNSTTSSTAFFVSVKLVEHRKHTTFHRCTNCQFFL